MSSSIRSSLILAVSLCLGSFISCDKLKESGEAPADKASPALTGEAAKLKTVKDADLEEAFAFRVKERQLYNARKFDDLETDAAKFRASKELFGNGSWKIAQFYESFGCSDKEPESTWTQHEAIHKDWIKAKPNSITARVACVIFLTEYAWHARGSGYADTVNKDGWRLFGERLASAHAVLKEAHALPEKDPVLWRAALTVALGESWDKTTYDDLVTEAVTTEPKFWGYDTGRAYSLLPRWYGEPGDWEAYADKAAARPNGLGPEIYARIVYDLDKHYGNIFKESKASWPKTKEGLQAMLKKYPKSVALRSNSARLAKKADDRAMAKAMFDELGDSFFPPTWKSRQEFVQIRHWAQEGVK